jgi:hypothetical protein
MLKEEREYHIKFGSEDLRVLLVTPAHTDKRKKTCSRRNADTPRSKKEHWDN